MKKIRRALCLCLASLYLISAALFPAASEPASGEETSAAAGETAASDPSQASPASLSQWPAGPELWAEAGILMDARTGTVLFGKNADKRLYPASITKLMTALLVLENCSLSEVVTFSYEATHSIEPDASHISTTEGEQMTVEQCMYALLLKSANEVANGLAEHVAGSMEAFADMMNERAAQLGCTNTHFVNAHGLHDENHYTTCHDMALIMQALIDNETFISISSADRYTIPPTNKQTEPRYLSQTHEMLRDSEYAYEGTVAGKNGYTPEAGNTLVTYAVRGNLELIAVSLKSNWHHYDDTIAMFDYGFNNFTAYNMAEIAGVPDTGSELPVSGSSLEMENSWVVLPNDMDPSSLETELTLDTEASDDIIAEVSYTYQGVRLGSGSLVLTGTEDPAPSIQFQDTGSSQTASRPSGEAFTIALWILAAVVAFLLLLLVFIQLTRRRRRKKRSVIHVRSAKKQLRHKNRYR